MKKLRNIISTIFIIISMSLCVSCGDASISTDVKINKDGSSNTTFKIVYDETIKKILGDGILYKIVDEDIDVNIYTEDNNTIEELKITTPKIKITDLIKGSKLSANNSSDSIDELIKYNINKEKGFLKDQYTVNINLTKNILQEVSTTLENKVDSNIDKYIAKTIENYISEIPYDLTISIPFKITNSNASNTIDDYTSKWSYTIGELNEDTIISLSFIAPSITSILLITIIIIVILLLIILIVRRRR